jgi:hypothetical protein
MVLKCATRDGAGFTSGAIRVLKMSIRDRGRRTGEYSCSPRTRRGGLSFDHGNVM